MLVSDGIFIAHFFVVLIFYLQVKGWKLKPKYMWVMNFRKHSWL